MAILNVEQAQTQGTVGIKKELDLSATHLIMDTIQTNQYQFPEASTVRELASNGVDSQSEKERVIQILKGEKKVEDYYIQRDDPKYKDSNFDASYYSLDWLDTKHNTVELHYYEGQGGGWCDKFIVKDYGVGLGDKRLAGYMNIGYSSKRNSTKAIGGFGYGAKASLSLRNDYYDMTSAHNGRLFKFRCYSYKVDSLIGQFNEDGTTNPHIEFLDKEGNPYVNVYYENTTSKNYTEISVPTKIFHRQKFTEAVRSQLLYFDNITYMYHESDGDVEKKNFKSKVLYTSRNLIISDQNQFSKPHIVVVKDIDQPIGISYGYINFQELEMQNIYSSAGFKCPMRQTVVDDNGCVTVIVEGIEITPNRESVIWSEYTRKYLQGIIENATKEAEELIANKLVEKDFVKWLYLVTQITNNPDDKVIRDISKIIDIKALKPIFTPEPTIKFDNNIAKMMLAFDVKHVKVEQAYVKGRYRTVLKRFPMINWQPWKNKVYLKEGCIHNFRKDCYIVSQDSDFVIINRLTDEELKDRCFKPNGDQQTIWIKDLTDFEGLKLIRDTIWALLKKSGAAIDYANYEVPEDYIKPNFNEENGGMRFDEDGNPIETEGELVIASEEKTFDPYAGLTPLERRKLEGNIVVHGLNYNTTLNGHLLKAEPRTIHKNGQWVTDPNWVQPNLTRFSKSEIRGTDFVTDQAEVFYGRGEEDDDLVVMASMIVGKANFVNTSHYGYGTNELRKRVVTNKLKILKVSGSMPKKYLANHSHISKYFGIKPVYSSEDKQITMQNTLIAWNTANLIAKELHKFQFMEGYEKVNPEVYQIYQEVKNFHDKYITEFQQNYRKELNVKEETFNNILKFCDKITEFQLFVRDCKNTEMIAAKSKEFFGVGTIEATIGIDLNIYDKLQALVIYANPVYSLLNTINFLNNDSTDISDKNGDPYNLLSEFLTLKGLGDFKFSDYGVTVVLPKVEELTVVEEEVTEEVD